MRETSSICIDVGPSFRKPVGFDRFLAKKRQIWWVPNFYGPAVFETLDIATMKLQMTCLSLLIFEMHSSL
jgi:hypothetical protein